MQMIKLLPDLVINKIAAGEVIESPASVVKELVENSLDAKAKNIRIEIKNSGMQLIKIEDDGCGMTKEDATLSIARHATSKLENFEDLQNIQTMGFRGEALASIAAVCKMEIKTAKENAYFLQVDAGKIVSLEKSARTNGTTIDVRSLFYNVPVRKKFQKSLGAILAEIHRSVVSLALSRPDVGFSFISNDKVIFNLDPQEGEIEKILGIRIQDLLGKDFFSNLDFISVKEGSFQVFGFVGKPSFIKKNRGSQYLFVNKRAVFSYLISKFVKEGFGTRMSSEDFPIFILHSEMPLDFIDINIHPQKKEIKFKDDFFVRHMIVDAVSKTLQKDFSFDENVFVKEEITFNRPINFSITDVKKESFEDFNKQCFLEEVVEKFYFQETLLLDNFFIVKAEEFPLKTELTKDGFLIFDLNAILAAILFEDLMNKNCCLEKQSLAIAITVDVEKDEMILVEEYNDLFSKLGFDIRIIVEKVVAFDAIPSLLDVNDISFVFHLILEDFSHVQTSDILLESFKKKIAQNICRFAKSKRKIFSKEMAINFLEKLFKCQNPYHDPLGRKTVINLEKLDIEKLFLRKT
jgi:DNA mismatch repair protein MutL